MRETKLWIGLLVIFTLSTTLQAAAKRYEVKSGMVIYKVEGGGSILGFSTKTTGTHTLYFKDWGNVEVRKEDEKETSMGKTTQQHTLQKIDHGTVYSVNEKHKTIIKQDIAMLKQMDKKGKNMSAMGKDMMKQMGGKKIGTGKVLGYPCEIWELMGSKTWLYKGVPLKTQANIMGFKHLEVATSAKFNVSISNSHFALPKYPIQTTDQMIQQQIQQAQHQSKHPQTQYQSQPSPQQMEQMQNMLKSLGSMFGGK